ncbi:hypothetical protein [Thauera sinica]|uniref:Lipoprotein n=1 Tax=Thauera sinica TaxID=2665146 RepID=A0ABW1ALQ2_9RHOO|nr:hypothetical protein [Thauera sp. K11]
MRIDRFAPGTVARQRATCAAAALLLAAGCTAIPPAPEAAPVRDEGDAASHVLAFHRGIQPLAAADLARERRQLGTERTAQSKMQSALLALHPRSLNLSRARTLLESVLAAQDAEAQPLHDLARLLLEQVNERLRLDALNERLAQQLDRSAAQLELSTRQQEEMRARADALQRKLDALAEIERNLSAPLPAATSPATASPTEERRTPP